MWIYNHKYHSDGKYLEVEECVSIQSIDTTFLYNVIITYNQNTVNKLFPKIVTIHLKKVTNRIFLITQKLRVLIFMKFI